MSGKATTVLDIRELIRYLREGQSNRAIHATLGLGRPTIAKYRSWAAAQGFLTGPLPSAADLHARLQTTLAPAPPQTISSVEPYRAVVQAYLDQGLEVEAIHQRLQGQGYAGHYQSVWRFVRKLQPERPEVTVRIETAPGQELQVDFGFAGRMWDPASEKVRRAWAFVATLAWSRHQYVEFVFDQSVPTWVMLHRHAFEAFGGVPAAVRLDNLKAGIVQASLDAPEAQRTYRECAEHYAFLITPCRPYTPEHKGKVESGVHYVARNFLAGRDYTTPTHSIVQANADVQRWVAEVAGQRRHGTTKQIPLEQFETIEQAVLRPLPAVPFEPATWKQVKLHRDCHIVFENAYYSAPHRFVGDSLWVRGTARTVEIHRDFERIATHSRATQPGQRLTLLDHLPPEKVAGLTLTPEACQARANQVGPQTAEVIARLLAERPVDRLRAVHRLLRWADQHEPARLERACARALAFGDVTVRTLENILKTGIAELPAGALAETAPDWPRFARDQADLIPAHLRR